MAHYAVLDENNIVVNVFVGKNENDPPGNWEEYYNAKRTSYNTTAGIYYEYGETTPSSDQSKAFRKNFASIGFTYDPIRDAFIPPKPYASWILDDFSCCWIPPIPYPSNPDSYFWDEDTLNWIPYEETIKQI